MKLINAINAKRTLKVLKGYTLFQVSECFSSIYEYGFFKVNNLAALYNTLILEIACQ